MMMSFSVFTLRQTAGKCSFDACSPTLESTGATMQMSRNRKLYMAKFKYRVKEPRRTTGDRTNLS